MTAKEKMITATYSTIFPAVATGIKDKCENNNIKFYIEYMSGCLSAYNFTFFVENELDIIELTDLIMGCLGTATIEEVR